MKILNKQELQQILIGYSSGVEFIKLYKKSIVKLSSFLVNDTTFASDSPLCFRCNLLNIKRENNN